MHDVSKVKSTLVHGPGVLKGKSTLVHGVLKVEYLGAWCIES